VSACSQAVYGRGVLVRNYDFDARRLEGVIYASELTGRRVLGMSDCLWGLVDGVNDAGLAVSLAFGGRKVTAPGFGISLVVRYLLETCATTAEALEVLARLPVQAAYNLTLLDAAGAAATAQVGPGGPPVLGRLPVATNHQHVADWPEHDAATRTREREERMVALLADPAVDEAAFVDAFLAPPLHNGTKTFGTLYTAVYRPADGVAEYRWPDAEWRQSLAAFEEGSRTVRLPVSKRAKDCSHSWPGQR
jgi:predicted choloylglycine hydrolase